jgi:hypothetical protein
MPTSGDRDRFAVAFGLNRHHGGAWLFGSLCMWINGRPLPEPLNDIPLSNFLLTLQSCREYPAARRRRSLDGLGPDKAFALFDKAPLVLEQADEHTLSVGEYWSMQRLDPVFVTFGPWRTCLIESPEADRLLYRAYGGAVGECLLRPGECDVVLRATFERLRAAYLAATGRDG